VKTLRILSGGAAQGLVGTVSARFEREAACRIDGTFSAVGAMQEKLLEGAPCDVVILTRAIVDALARDGLVAPDTVADLGRVFTGVAVREGDARPAIADAQELRTALASASSLYHPDHRLATAGVHFIRVLEGLGIRAEVEPRLRAFPNGATAMRELARATDARPLGVTQVTEIRMTPGTVLVGVLPNPYELVTTYTAAVCARAALPELARRLIRTLCDVAATDVGRTVGIEP